MSGLTRALRGALTTGVQDGTTMITSGTGLETRTETGSESESETAKGIGIGTGIGIGIAIGVERGRLPIGATKRIDTEVIGTMMIGEGGTIGIVKMIVGGTSEMIGGGTIEMIAEETETIASETE
jgi:hypothetical protein